MSNQDYIDKINRLRFKEFTLRGFNKIRLDWIKNKCPLQIGDITVLGEDVYLYAGRTAKVVMIRVEQGLGDNWNWWIMVEVFGTTTRTFKIPVEV